MNCKQILKSVSLAFLVLCASQSVLAMEKEPKDIFEAITQYDIKAVKHFLNNGIDINGTNIEGETSIMHACYKYDCYHFHPDRQKKIEQIIEELLEREADVNIGDEHGSTPLIRSVWSSFSLVKMLLEYGADVDGKDKGGFTALQAAAMTNDLQCVRLLLSYGASVNCYDYERRRTPLAYACKRESYAIAKELLLYNPNVNFKNAEGETPLHVALKHFNKALVSELLKRGADVNSISKKGITPLWQALFSDSDVDIIEQLLKMDADVNFMHNKRTPLWFASREGYYSLVVELIKGGAYVTNNEIKVLWNNSQTESLLIQTKEKQEQERAAVVKEQELRKLAVDRRYLDALSLHPLMSGDTNNSNVDIILNNSFVLNRDKAFQPHYKSVFVLAPPKNVSSISAAEKTTEPVSNHSWINRAIGVLFSAWSDLSEYTNLNDDENE